MLLKGGAVPLILVSFAATAVAQLDSGAPWPCYAHDNQHTGRGVKSLASGGAEGTIRWSFDSDSAWLPGEFVNQGAVLSVDGRLYVPTTKGRLFCLSATTGVPLWNQPFDTGKGIPVMTPMIVSGGISGGQTMSGGPMPPIYHIVFAVDKTVFCIRNNPYTGQPETLWTYPYDHTFSGTPVARPSDGRMYFGASVVPHVLAIGPTGSLAWELSIDDGAMASWNWLTMDQAGVIYATTYAWKAIYHESGSLYCIQDGGASATVRWSFTPDFDGEGDGWSNPFSAASLGAQGQVYFGTKDTTDATWPSGTGTVWAIAENQGIPYELWRVNTSGVAGLGAVPTTPNVAPDTCVYFGSNGLGIDDSAGFLTRAWGPPGTSQYLAEAPDGGNFAGTGCLAVNTGGALLAAFAACNGPYPEENLLYKVGPSGNVVWSCVLPQPPDGGALAMGRDGTVYLGTNVVGTPSHGAVYAVWGFTN